MNLSEEERIDAYLRKQLSPEEQQTFEKELEESSDLQESLHQHLEAMMAIRQAAFQAEVQAGIPEAPSATIRSFQAVRWLVAASVVLLLGLILWQFSRRPSDQQLFTEYYQPPKIAENIRGGDPDKNSIPETTFTQAQKRFADGQYQEALTLFLQTKTDSLSQSNQSWRQLLIGICHLELGQYAESRTFIRQANEHPNPQDWYLALLDLAESKRPEAQERLRAIAEDESHLYVLQARALLEKF